MTNTLVLQKVATTQAYQAYDKDGINGFVKWLEETSKLCATDFQAMLYIGLHHGGCTYKHLSQSSGFSIDAIKDWMHDKQPSSYETRGKMRLLIAESACKLQRHPPEGL